MIDPILKEKGMNDLIGEVAIASVKKAYNIYQEAFTSDQIEARIIRRIEMAMDY